MIRRRTAGCTGSQIKQIPIVLALLLLISRAALVGQDPLAHARELYEAADYDGALIALDAADDDTASTEQQQSAREYRALCLLALDRSDEMSSTIEAMVRSDPFYRPSPDRTPRFLIAFNRIHRGIVPSLAHVRFEEARTKLGNKDYKAAAAGFEGVLRLLDTTPADARQDESPEPSLSSLRASTTQMLDATRAALRPPAKPAAPAPQLVSRPPAAYRSGDAGVTAPVPILQDIPPWQSRLPYATGFTGELELLINRRGDVEQARITTSIHPGYDAILLRAAAKWKYQPALKDGQPVPYLKAVTISLMSQGNVQPTVQ